MVKGKKHLPIYLENNYLEKILKSNLVIIGTYLVFQSCLHTNIKETLFKLSITLILTLALMNIVNLFVAILIAHLLNALFNGHIPAMLIHMGIGSKSPEEFIIYIEKIQNRLSKNSNIDYAFAYGSLSRGVYKPTSDLDIRVIPRNKNWFKCLFILLRERTLALINWFPLDIYAFDEGELKIKMRSDEKPICFKSANAIYDDEIKFNEFSKIFKRMNLKVSE